MKTKKELLVCYQVVTPESASIGDFDETGVYDTKKDYSIMDIINFILDQGCISASSSNFHKGIWYQTEDPEVDYKSGSETTYSFHLKGYSEAEELELYNRLIGID